MLLKNTCLQFSNKSSPQLDFFSILKKCPKCSPLWKFRLDIPLDGILVTIFVLHSFLCFHDLKLGNTITMTPRMVALNLVFHTLLEKNTFVDFQQGEKGFCLFDRDSQSKF